MQIQSLALALVLTACVAPKESAQPAPAAATPSVPAKAAEPAPAKAAEPAPAPEQPAASAPAPVEAATAAPVPAQPAQPAQGVGPSPTGAVDSKTSMFGEPLYVNGRRVSDDEIKLALIYGPCRMMVDLLKVGLLMEDEIQRQSQEKETAQGKS